MSSVATTKTNVVFAPKQFLRRMTARHNATEYELAIYRMLIHYTDILY